jgi:hypothetical protein
MSDSENRVKDIRDRWRPMSDTPPEGMHLVYAPSADPKRPVIVTAWWLADDRQWSIIVKYWANAVTHWMPLPTPPSE